MSHTRNHIRNYRVAREATEQLQDQHFQLRNLSHWLSTLPDLKFEQFIGATASSIIGVWPPASILLLTISICFPHCIGQQSYARHLRNQLKIKFRPVILDAIQEEAPAPVRFQSSDCQLVLHLHHELSFKRPSSWDRYGSKNNIFRMNFALVIARHLAPVVEQ